MVRGRAHRLPPRSTGSPIATSRSAASTSPSSARRRGSSARYYDDVLEVRTEVAGVSGARIAFTYEIYRDGVGADRHRAHGARRGGREGRPASAAPRRPVEARVKVVVTGAAGFIGSHLRRVAARGRARRRGRRRLRRDYYPREVKARQSRPRPRPPGLSPRRGQRAGHRPRGRCWRGVGGLPPGRQAGVRAWSGQDFAVYTDNNVLATQRLLEAAVAAGVPRLVYASSSSVYGDSAAPPLQRDSGVPPGLAVRGDEAGGRAPREPVPFEHGSAGGQPAVLHGVRPAAAAGHGVPPVPEGGAGQDRAIRLFGDGGQTRDFTYIDDIVAATRAAAGSGGPAASTTSGAGRRVSMNRT